jgi:hypothetical protein
MSPADTLIIADYYNSRIREVGTNGIIQTIVNIIGTLGVPIDGQTATEARISGPNALTYDPAGRLYFSDWGAPTFWRVAPGGWRSCRSVVRRGFTVVAAWQ